MAYTTVADLTVDQFKDIIREVVIQTLTEILGDPDEGLELCDDIKVKIQQSLAALDAGKKTIPVRRLDFWKQLLEKAKTNLHSNVSPSMSNRINAGAGKYGMSWDYRITMDECSVELYIDRGKDKKDETDKIYEKIFNNREKIENQFGGPLIWDKKEGRQGCIIKSVCNLGGLKSPELWDKIQEDMIERMIRLEKALKQTLSTIK